MRTKHTIPLLLLLLLFTQQAWSQTLRPAFSMSAVSGCSPLPVIFTDQTTGGTPPYSYQWDLGNGTITTSARPGTTYFYTEGGDNSFTVKLNVKDKNGVVRQVVYTDTIKVFPSANVRFRASNNVACVTAPIQFTDQTTIAPPGSIVKWEWDFGDGSPVSNQKNPVHVYDNIGYYNVTLTVTTSNGCTVTLPQNRFMRIIGGVTPNFDFSRSNSCSVPIDVAFNNQTTGPGILTHRWNLGNGVNSSVKNPTTTYSALGTYNVTLTTSSNYGCTSSITKPITFSADDTKFTAPDSVCPNNPITFINNGSSTPSSADWDFGDGTSSREINPSKAFTTPGTYTVTLINHYAECSGTFSKTIKVTNPPQLGFTADNASGCQAPLAVSFHDTTANSSNWLWDFGDGQTSTEKNPVHTYTSEGSFDVTLTITNALGCPSTVTSPAFVNIKAPSSATITDAGSRGCIPFEYKPAASLQTIDNIASYLWDFGDGSTGSGPNPSHTYTSFGRYEVKVTITTSTGCVITYTKPDSIRVGTPPVIDFTASTNFTCAGDTVQFTSLASPADEWLWFFGDSTSSSSEHPRHLYEDTGHMTVTLIAYNNGCADTLEKPNLLETIAPVAKFAAEYNCANPLQVHFDNQSIEDPTHGATTYFWDFGDGTTFAGKDPPNKTYSSYQPYTVTLTATDPQCHYVKTMVIEPIRIVPDAMVDSVNYCRNELITLSIPSSVNLGNVKSYGWFVEGIGNLPDSASSAQVRIPNNGNYDVTLTLVDKNNCTTSVTKPDLIKIVGVENDFSVANNGGCVNAQIGLSDQSQLNGGTIQSWSFNFGDGQSESFSAPPFSHTYAQAGSYTILLTTKDSFGCTDTTSKQAVAVITKPQVNFGALDTVYCPDIAVQFGDSTLGTGLTHQWFFGDGGTSTDQHPLHTYTGPDSVYTVKLIVTDGNGCVDSLIRTNYMRIVAPVVAFDAIDTSAICPPLETKFISRSTNLDSLYWDFGDGNTSNLPNTSNFYNTYGNYTATLNVIGYHGCLRSASTPIAVHNPGLETSFTYGPLEDCNTLTATFTIVPPPHTKFKVFFGDAMVDSSQNRIITHTYGKPGIYTPSIQLTDSLDCQVTVGGKAKITVNGILPLFGMSQKQFCDTGTIEFRDYSLDGSDSITTRDWTMGDGNSMSGIGFNYHYDTPGIYYVTEYMTTAKGCSNNYTDTVYVYRTPQPVIIGPDEICVGSILELKATTVVPDTLVNWKWTYGNGLSSTQPVILNAYNNPGASLVSLTATNLLGCASDTSKQIMVWPNPVITNVPEVVIPVGSGIMLPVTYSPNVETWTWSPSTALECTNCPTPYANPQFNTTYKIDVVDSNGCKANSNIVVKVICVEQNYFIPNTFSPNNDGQNDVFYPRGSGLHRIQSMRVFNRWGELVFERKNFPANSKSDGWNGLIRGMPAQSDAYVYIIEVICDNGQIIPLKGNVTLIR